MKHLFTDLTLKKKLPLKHHTRQQTLPNKIPLGPPVQKQVKGGPRTCSWSERPPASLGGRSPTTDASRRCYVAWSRGVGDQRTVDRCCQQASATLSNTENYNFVLSSCDPKSYSFDKNSHWFKLISVYPVKSIMFLKIIHRPVYFLKTVLLIFLNNFSETEFRARPQVKPTQVGGSLRNVLFWKINRTIFR